AGAEPRLRGAPRRAAAAARAPARPSARRDRRAADPQRRRLAGVLRARLPRSPDLPLQPLLAAHPDVPRESVLETLPAHRLGPRLAPRGRLGAGGVP